MISAWFHRMLLILPLGFLACTKPSVLRVENPEVVQIDELPQDFKMPALIWDLAQGTEVKKSVGGAEAGQEPKKEEKPAEGGTEKSGGNPGGIVYTAVKVLMTEKNDHILKSPAYQVQLPSGGGLVDLAKFTTGKPGSYFVGFDLPAEFQEGKNFHVFFVSTARKRRIEDRVYGGGCTQFFDITAKFLEMMKSEGLRVNTTRERDVTVLAGHYIFSVVKDEQVYVSQVTITDSQHKNLLCEGS